MTPVTIAGPLISVLVPVSERAVPLGALYHAYSEVLRKAGFAFEFVFAAEPWHAQLLQPLTELQASGEPIRMLEVAQSLGEATLLRLAASRASGAIYITVPAYWRVDPAIVLEMIARIEGGSDLVIARRWPRCDSWVNRLQNRIFHALVRLCGGRHFHDIACGVRAFRPEVLDETPLYGDFHRFFPLLVDRAGFRVVEIAAPQHPMDTQPHIYSPAVYARRALDLLGMYFLLRFTHKPLRFFGLLGSGMAAAGSLVLVVLMIQRLGGQGIADRPLLLLAALLVALGVQAIALGLIGEIMVFLQAPDRPPYKLARDFESAAVRPHPGIGVEQLASSSVLSGS
jgi:hypothetical protein